MLCSFADTLASSVTDHNQYVDSARGMARNVTLRMPKTSAGKSQTRSAIMLLSNGSPRPPSKKYVESLQARIRHLEERLEASESRLARDACTSDLFENNVSEEEPDLPTDEADDDPLSNLTGLVGRLNMTDDGQLHYFGSQSSYNLLKRSLSEASPGEPSLRMQKQGLDAAAQLNRQVNVSAELQEHLLQLYWQWQNPWNYIVHKDAFMQSYRGQDDGRNCSPLLLSCIFAMAARYSDRVELRSVASDPSTAGDAFCEQAKILMLFESEAPSITTVQAACILALRIMSDGKEALGWLYAGRQHPSSEQPGLCIDAFSQETLREWRTTLDCKLTFAM